MVRPPRRDEDGRAVRLGAAGPLVGHRARGQRVRHTAEEGTQSSPPLETLRRFLPQADRWPIGTRWNFHAGRPGSTFDTFHWTTDAIDRRYGRATRFTDYSGKAELKNYETAEVVLRGVERA